MSDRLERLSALAGLGGVLLWVVGIVILEAVAGAFPEGASPDEARGYFQENENAVVVGSFIFMVGGAFFLWFTGVLRGSLLRAEGGTGTFSTIALIGGVATAVFATGIPGGQLAAGLNADNLDGSAALALNDVRTIFFVGAEVSAIVLLLATGVVSLAARALPHWWALVSILLAVVLVIGPIGWAGLIFGLPVWTIVTSLLLLTRRAPTEAPAAAGVSA